MLCEKCGLKLPEGSLYCPRCGNKVDTNYMTSEKDPPVKLDDKEIILASENNGPFTQRKQKASKKRFFLALVLAGACFLYYILFQPFIHGNLDSGVITELGVSWGMSKSEVEAQLPRSGRINVDSDSIMVWMDNPTKFVFGAPVDHMYFSFSGGRLDYISITFSANINRLKKRYANRYGETEFLDEWRGERTKISFSGGNTIATVTYMETFDLGLYRYPFSIS